MLNITYIVTRIVTKEEIPGGVAGRQVGDPVNRPCQLCGPRVY